MPDPSDRTSIQRLIDVVEFTGGIAGVANPVIGAAAVATALGARFVLGEKLSMRRARILVRKAQAGSEPLPALLWRFANLGARSKDAAFRELRLLARSAENAPDEAAVPPIVEILRMLSIRDIDGRRAASLCRLVEQLNAVELVALRLLLAEIIAVTPAQYPVMHAISRQKFDDGTYGSGTTVDGKRVRLSTCVPATRLFRLLRDNDLAQPDVAFASGAAVGPETGDHTPIESIRLTRSDVTVLLRVLEA